MKKELLVLLALIMLMVSCQKDDSPLTPDHSIPVIHSLVLQHDTLHIFGSFGPVPGIGFRRLIINEDTVAEKKIVEWKEEKITAVVEKKEPEEKKVQVEVQGKKSNAKIINIPVERIVRLDYLQVEEPAGNLYIHGIFGTDPGPAKRAIVIEQFTNRLIRTEIRDIISWRSNLIVCKIPNTGEGSHGKVIVRVENDSAYRGLYQYNFVIDFKRPQGGASGTLAEKVKFFVWLRGDGDVAPASVPVIDLKTNLHDESHARWEADGEGSSSYNNEEGCAGIFVQWQHVSSDEYVQPNQFPVKNTGWRSFVTHKRDGFDLKIDFEAKNEISSKVTVTPCTGAAYTQDRKESIVFDEFESDIIHLRYEHERIKGNELKKTGLTSTVGLQWDVKEFPLHFMTATLKWNSCLGELD